MNIITNSKWDIFLKSNAEPLNSAGLMSAVHSAYRTETVYPPINDVLKAFTLTPPQRVQVVILGQDPYHAEAQAHGLAFSVPDGVAIPPSLRNIFQEIYTDIGIHPPLSGDLSRWAEQGVLLLNTTLTVRAGEAGSHRHLGWEDFTNVVISTLSDKRTNVVFMLWGNHAIAKAAFIDPKKHLILTAPHPSPLSAYRGFFGCRHFSQCNNYLKKTGQNPIIW